MRQVSRAEYQKFIADYPHELAYDVCGISEPPLASYNDFRNKVVWPESMVAKHHVGTDRYWIKD